MENQSPQISNQSDSQLTLQNKKGYYFLIDDITEDEKNKINSLLQENPQKNKNIISYIGENKKQQQELQQISIELNKKIEHSEIDVMEEIDQIIIKKRPDKKRQIIKRKQSVKSRKRKKNLKKQQKKLTNYKLETLQVQQELTYSGLKNSEIRELIFNPFGSNVFQEFNEHYSMYSKISLQICRNFYYQSLIVKNELQACTLTSIPKEISKNDLNLDNFFRQKKKIDQMPQDQVEQLLYIINQSIEIGSQQKLIDLKTQHKQIIMQNRHLIVTAGDIPEQKILKITQEDNKGYLNLTYDVLENERLARKEYLSNLKEQIAKVLEVNTQDIHFFGVEKGSKQIVMQIIDPDTNRVRTYTEEDIRNLELHFGEGTKIDEDYAFKNIKLYASDLDTQYNMQWGMNHTHQCKRGKIKYSDGIKNFPYYFPRGWNGLALNVSGLYDNNNDDWIAMDGRDNEWAVLYHGTEALEQIVRSDNKLKPGTGQNYKDAKCMITDQVINQGVYFSNHIEVCESYCRNGVKLGNHTYLVAFQCRVKPDAIRQVKKNGDRRQDQDQQKCKIQGNAEWDNDYFVINKPEDSRPYRILIKQK